MTFARTREDQLPPNPQFLCSCLCLPNLDSPISSQLCHQNSQQNSTRASKFCLNIDTPTRTLINNARNFARLNSVDTTSSITTVSYSIIFTTCTGTSSSAKYACWDCACWDCACWDCACWGCVVGSCASCAAKHKLKQPVNRRPKTKIHEVSSYWLSGGRHFVNVLVCATELPPTDQLPPPGSCFVGGSFVAQAWKSSRF